MALAIETDGSQTATLDTEHTLAAVVGAKTRVLVVDLVNMAAGDVVVLRIKTAARAAGTERIVEQAVFRDVPAKPISMSVPVPMANGGTITLEQTDGTGRVFPWAIYSL